MSESRDSDETETSEWQDRDRDETETLEWQHRDETETSVPLVRDNTEKRRSKQRLETSGWGRAVRAVTIQLIMCRPISTSGEFVSILSWCVLIGHSASDSKFKQGIEVSGSACAMCYLLFTPNFSSLAVLKFKLLSKVQIIILFSSFAFETMQKMNAETNAVVPETEINANHFFTHIHTFETFMFYALVLNSS